MNTHKTQAKAGYASKAGILLLAVALLASGCTKVDFTTQDNTSDPKKFGEPPGSGGDGDGGGGTGGGTGGGDDAHGTIPVGPGGGTNPPGSTPPNSFGPPNPARGIFEFSTAVNRDYIWVVTNLSGNSMVYLVKLEGSSGAVTKTWTIPKTASTGARTFVTEFGLFVGKAGGHLYRIDESMPEDKLVDTLWSAPNAASGARMCLTSFKIGTTSYLGIAWESASGRRMFTRAPIDPSRTSKVVFAAAQTVDLGAGTWSYGCYTDQARKFFWSAWAGSPLYGVNLSTLTALDPSVHAPNAGHTNQTLGSARQLNPGAGQNGSYALSGDANGNLLTGTDIYTYSHDARTNVVFGSKSAASRLVVADASCFSTDAGCANKVFEADLSGIGRIGPMSSLNDGRVIGIVRGTPSQVYVMRLTDPTDLSKLVTATRVAEVAGNAYMYNDFTGYSLSVSDLDLTVDISKLQNFNPSLPVKSLSFTWLAQGGGNAKWEGLTLDVRCYKAGSPQGEFQRVSNVNDAGQETPLAVSSCQNKLVDRVDLRVRAAVDGSTNFTRTSQIKIYGTH